MTKDDIEAIVRQVEQAIKSGLVDSELESSREVRQKARDALMQSDRIDPEKLRIWIDI